MSILNITIKPELSTGIHTATLKAYGEQENRLTADGNILKGYLFLKWTNGEAESIHRIYCDTNNEQDCEILGNYIKAIQEQMNFTGTIPETLEKLKNEKIKIEVLITEKASEDGARIYKNFNYKKSIINTLK